MANGFDEVSDQYREIEEIDSLWNLSEDFSVTDAAALISDYNPTAVEHCQSDTYFDRAFHGSSQY